MLFEQYPALTPLAGKEVPPALYSKAGGGLFYWGLSIPRIRRYK
jgi:hypothetical protein